MKPVLPAALSTFLTDEPAATVALPIDKAGTIHIATLLYWHQPKPFTFYFVTGKHTEKCTLLVQKISVQGACVIGTYKGTPFSLQMRGTFRLADPGAHQVQIAAYYKKRGSRSDDIDDPANVLIRFQPNWARYTDYTAGRARHMLAL